MNPENLILRVRPRSHWEALDTGMLLARHWYARLYVMWIVIAGPIFAGVFLILHNHPGWTMLIVWWLKPLYERLPLKFLSLAVFDSQPPMREAIVKGLSALRPAMASALTVRRFSPVRSFEAPVYVLEGAGKDRKRRVRVLQQKAGSAALWLMVIGVHIEAFIVMGLLVGIVLFLFPGTEINWLEWLLSGLSPQYAWEMNLLTFLAMSLVAPFYISCGFALYLNRRVELEGWDLEMGLRRLATRVRSSTRTLPVMLIVLLLIPYTDAFALQAPAEPRPQVPVEDLFEAEQDTLSEVRRQSRTVIDEVLADAAFHELTTVRFPKFLEDLLNAEAQDNEDADWSWLPEFFRIVSLVLEVLLWVAAIAALLWLGYRVRLFDWLSGGGWRSPFRRPFRRSGMVAGLAVSEDSLPAQVSRSAMQLWENGDPRQAMSLLYRATLSRLMTRFDCNYSRSDTEADCLTIARRQTSTEIADYVGELTAAWVSVAYAHRLPSTEDFVELQLGWQQRFGEAEDES